MTASMSSEKDWQAYKEKMKIKRAQKGKEKQPKVKEKTNELIVQRLSATVSGKAQKYSRVGPREFVSYGEDELSIDGIKTACEKHFAPLLTGKLNCDIPAGEQGPSCSSLSQIPNTKLIHVRFIGRTSKSAYRDVDDISSDEASDATCESPRKKSKSQPSPAKISNPTSKKTRSYSKSLSVVEMMKLGKLVTKQRTHNISLQSFDISDMSWTKEALPVEFVLQEEPFGVGGFRKVLKATSSHPKYSSKQWVIKKYLPEALNDLKTLNQPVDSYTKKVVQMHSLAKHFAASLEKKVEDCKDFGQPIQYTDISYGSTDDGESVTVEEFVPGDFVKFINNNGLIEVENNDEACKKAQCLAHYSYEKSGKEMMVLDIQGSGNVMYDPEIASATLRGEDDNILFCAGNLSVGAMNNFIDGHNCNEYCQLAGLEKLDKTRKNK